MPFVNWFVQYIDPADRSKPAAARSDMRYAATREGVQRLDGSLRPIEERPEAMSSAEGLQYIARRRGAMAYRADHAPPGSDGLFCADGKADLAAECARIAAHPDSTEWRAVLSFDRDDLLRSGYFSPAALQRLLTAKMPEVGRAHGISPENLIWNAAFHPVDKHGGTHHPHVHIYFYSTDPNEGRMSRKATKRALEKARSLFTNAVFREEMQQIGLLGQEARRQLCRTVDALHTDPDWPSHCGLTTDFDELCRLLPEKGKAQYGYLPSSTKKVVDRIVQKMLEHPAMQGPFRQLEEAQRALIGAYNDDPAKIGRRLQLWEKQFYHPTEKGAKAVLHNAVIRQSAALRQDLPDHRTDEPPTDETDDRYREKLIRGTAQGDAEAMYALARLLETEQPQLAQRLYRAAAKRGSVWALFGQARQQEKAGDACAAARSYEKLAKAGMAEAMYRLGRLAETGGNGLLADAGLAEMWLEKAAAEGHTWSLLRMAQRYAKDDPDKQAAYRRQAICGLEQLTAEEPTEHLPLHRLLGQLYEQDGDPLGAIYEYTLARADAACMGALVRLSGDRALREHLQAQRQNDPAADAGCRLLERATRWGEDTEAARRQLLADLRLRPAFAEELSGVLPGRRWQDLSVAEQQTVDRIIRDTLCPTTAYMRQRLRGAVLSAYSRRCLWENLRSLPPQLRRQIDEDTAPLRRLQHGGIDCDTAAYRQALHAAADAVAARSPVFRSVADREPQQFACFLSALAEHDRQWEEQTNETARGLALAMLTAADRLTQEAQLRQAQRYQAVEHAEEEGKQREKQLPAKRGKRRKAKENAPEQEP